uniref:XPG-I domain-containing protein n=1 Tax=Parascaris univalens TaxID=6257 RepID=A0A915AGS4_PARUN
MFHLKEFCRLFALPYVLKVGSFPSVSGSNDKVELCRRGFQSFTSLRYKPSNINGPSVKVIFENIGYIYEDNYRFLCFQRNISI